MNHKVQRSSKSQYLKILKPYQLGFLQDSESVRRFLLFCWCLNVLIQGTGPFLALTKNPFRLKKEEFGYTLACMFFWSQQKVLRIRGLILDSFRCNFLVLLSLHSSSVCRSAPLNSALNEPQTSTAVPHTAFPPQHFSADLISKSKARILDVMLLTCCFGLSSRCKHGA